MGPNLQKALSLGGKKKKKHLGEKRHGKKNAVIIKRRKSSGMSIRLFSLYAVLLVVGIMRR